MPSLLRWILPFGGLSLVAMVLIDRALGQRAEFLNAVLALQPLSTDTPPSQSRRLG